MQRVLCLGNNSEDTDIKTRLLAQQAGAVCYGLLSEIDGYLSSDSSYSLPGYYHTSIFDIEYGRLIGLANQFDCVIMLDQPKDQWTHPDAFYNTVRVMKSIQTNTLFQNKSFSEGISFWENLVETNKSFCIFPFIELLSHGEHSTVCCRSSTPIVKIDDIIDFRTQPEYQKIRQKMIQGEKLPEHCSSCYKLESLGIRSARQQETIEWANRLDLESLEQLKNISEPAYYEIRSSNKCNLQCRMCTPSLSHLIDSEYRQIGLLDKNSAPTRSYEKGFEIIDFKNLKKLYVAGGEPLIMPEFYNFLDDCISTDKTDFEFIINTNGTKISEKFKKQIKHFSNLQFIFSIDGYQDLNHYIRWPSDWETIIGNWRYLKENNHKVIINTTVSIYNIAQLDKLYQFIDKEFPGTLVHAQIVESTPQLSPFNYPDHDYAIKSLEKVKTTQCYLDDPLFANTIDGYITIFKGKNTNPSLKDFFEFNDLLDQSRSISLKNYLPELELYRPKTH